MFLPRLIYFDLVDIFACCLKYFYLTRVGIGNNNYVMCETPSVHSDISLNNDVYQVWFHP